MHSTNRCTWQLLSVFGMFISMSVKGESLEPPRKAASVVYVSSPSIVPDGKLDEPVWQAAPDNTGFELGLERGKRETVPEDVQTHFRVVHDDGTLYIGIRCNDSMMARLRPFENHGAWDPAMWMHDTVEIFMDPTGGHNQYYHFAVDPENAQFDEFCWTNSPYSAIWQTACYKGSNFWSVELTIPFGAFWRTPTQQWATNWTFSMSRLVQTHGLATTYSPVNGGFHDVKNFGTLGPITSTPGRFNITPSEPHIRLLRLPTGGLMAQASLPVLNAGKEHFIGTAALSLLANKEETPIASSPLDLAGAMSTNLLIEFPIANEGPGTMLIRVNNPDGELEAAMRTAVVFTYEPITLTLLRPAFRHNIYTTEHLATIKGDVMVDMPDSQTTGKMLRATLTGPAIETRSTNWVFSETHNTFRLKADDLPIGTYELSIDLLPSDATFDTSPLAHYVTELRKLATAPDLEARIDADGNLLVDGHAVTLRGWYGGFSDDIANTLALTLPSTCNFNWGAVKGKWCLVDLRNAYSDQDAKTDAPMDEATRERLLHIVRSTQGRSDVIAYYIAEEPGGFGLSAGYLKKVYEVVAEADPYRIIMMVGGWPGSTDVADAAAIQPFGGALQAADGQRWLGRDHDEIGDMRSGVRQITATRPPGKAIWCRMPCNALPTTGDERRRYPNLTELRWITFTAIINGVKSLLPHHANLYEAHYGNRVAMDAIFEDLAWLEPVILANDGPILTCDEPRIDAIARTRPVFDGMEATVIISANQSYSNCTATFHVDSMEKNQNTRILVAREDRVLTVTNGTFTDTFAPLAVHIYTTQEVLPAFKTLPELEAELRAPFEAGRKAGNLLLDPTVKWRVGMNSLPPFMSPDPTAEAADLVDGLLDGGWAPWDDDRSQCVVWFEQPVTFSRISLQTRTIRSAEIEILDGREWRRIGGWDDAYINSLHWQGAPVTTSRVRIRILATRGNAQASIGELGFYQ